MQLRTALVATCISILPLAASAEIVRISEEAFLADAGLITFSEFSVGTVNPTYAPVDYGGGANAPTVTTGGFFTGQSLSADPTTDCPTAAATACLVGTPTGPLSLDLGSPNTFIANDGAFPTSPTLSGTPLFNGPIALLFSEDQAAVGFEGGFFDNIAGTGITAYDRGGNRLGTVENEETGIEFLGLATEDGNSLIAGVQLDLVGLEDFGFNIDNVRFGAPQQIMLPPSIAPIPVPAALPALLGGVALLGMMRRRNT